MSKGNLVWTRQSVDYSWNFGCELKCTSPISHIQFFLFLFWFQCIMFYWLEYWEWENISHNLLHHSTSADLTINMLFLKLLKFSTTKNSKNKILWKKCFFFLKYSGNLFFLTWNPQIHSLISRHVLKLPLHYTMCSSNKWTYYCI